MLVGRSAHDLGGVVGEEVAVAGELLARPLDPVDVALDHLDADRRAAGVELLRRHDRARQDVAVGAVFRGDALGDVIDDLERHLLVQHVLVQRQELLVVVDRRSGDHDAADGQDGLARRRPAPRCSASRCRRRRVRRAARRAAGTSCSRSRPGCTRARHELRERGVACERPRPAPPPSRATQARSGRRADARHKTKPSRGELIRTGITDPTFLAYSAAARPFCALRLRHSMAKSVDMMSPKVR